jgi:phosphoglycerate kinase
MIKYIDGLKSEDLKGKKVLLRLDLNVAVKEGKVIDDFDIQKIIPTVDFLREHESQVIIVAHIEDAQGNPTSLHPVWDYLKGYFPCDFCPTYFTPESIDMLVKMQNKSVLLFENVRNNKGEKENDPEFAKKLAQMADVYVNDAFGVSHRKHASIVGVPAYLPHYGGLLMRQEIENISKAFKPQHPFVFILGGAKFDTKLPLIKKYLDKADTVFVGGALANNLLRDIGHEVGESLVASGDFGTVTILHNPALFLPPDATVTAPDGGVCFRKANEVKKNETIVDVGPQTITRLKDIMQNAKTIVWNGPLGNYEIGFKDKTESLAHLIAEATSRGAESIVGGGDTIASINTLGLESKFSFISTGGGAMLDFLMNETLPGIEALEK